MVVFISPSGSLLPLEKDLTSAHLTCIHFYLMPNRGGWMFWWPASAKEQPGHLLNLLGGYIQDEQVGDVDPSQIIAIGKAKLERRGAK